ncbi:MAG: DNA methyltransferase [bacterium]
MEQAIREQDHNFFEPIKITKEIKEKSKLTKEEWKEWTKTVWSIANVSDENHPAIFPFEIPYRLIRMFSYYNEVVLDPFSGMSTTGEAALDCGRKYIGYELNSKYIDISTQKLIQTANQKNKKGKIKTHSNFILLNKTSKDMSYVPDDSIGTIVTSPPYWNKANYGEQEDNIGNLEHYDIFLDSVKEVIKECYRVLKPGRRLSIVTANVNQNTKKYGLLTFPIATDLIKKAQEVGFVLVNELIWSKDGTGGKWGSYGKQRPIFGSYPYPPNFLFKNVHEYIIVLKKMHPKKNNPKAPEYDDLFLNTY